MRSESAGTETLPRRHAELLTVPPIIADAGDQAVEQYRAFFDSVIRSTTTRDAYLTAILRFCSWARGRGLSLGAISSTEVTAYAEEFGRSVATSTCGQYLTALRSFFRHLTETGVVPNNPCTAVFADRQESSEVTAGFELLALMAMLANMDEDSLQLILNDEETAVSLLEQVRWPGDLACPDCGRNDIETTNGGGHVHCCLGCGKEFTALAGTLFDESPLPLRHWMRLIHQRVPGSEPVIDAALINVDAPSLHSFCSRLELVMKREKIPAGVGLMEALDAKDRELVNNQFARYIIRYAEMESARESLIKAKAEGAEVPALPPGVSLDAALAALDARIAEEDRWVFYLENDRILRKLADETSAASPGEARNEQ
jgi:hypothetical protein